MGSPSCLPEPSLRVSRCAIPFARPPLCFTSCRLCLRQSALRFRILGCRVVFGWRYIPWDCSCCLLSWALLRFSLSKSIWRDSWVKIKSLRILLYLGLHPFIAYLASVGAAGCPAGSSLGGGLYLPVCCLYCIAALACALATEQCIHSARRRGKLRIISARTWIA